MLRCRYGALRGVLSDRYARMDHSQLLGCALPLLEGRFEPQRLAITDEGMHLRLVDPRLSRDVLRDDRLMVGVHIANSEVGKRAVTVDAIVLRLVCQNGLVRLVRGRSLLYQRHVSLSQGEFEIALRRAVSEAVTAAAGLIERLALATMEPVCDVEGALGFLAERWSLTNGYLERVRWALLSERPAQQETLYGLVNALTQAAQGLSPDERYDAEVMAGKLLESGPPQVPRTTLAGRTQRSQALPDSLGHRNAALAPVPLQGVNR
jgi:hypothetical protein